jgi:hypothetical protein
LKIQEERWKLISRKLNRKTFIPVRFAANYSTRSDSQDDKLLVNADSAFYMQEVKTDTFDFLFIAKLCYSQRTEQVEDIENVIRILF